MRHHFRVRRTRFGINIPLLYKYLPSLTPSPASLDRTNSSTNPPPRLDLPQLTASLASKLIDVTTATHPPEASEASGLKHSHEYPRIFGERFAHLGHLHLASEAPSRSASITQYNTDAPQSSRPPSSGASESKDTEVTDEEAWLASLLKHISDQHLYDEDDNLALPWDQVIGAEQAKGSLVKKFFGDVGVTRQAIRA